MIKDTVWYFMDENTCMAKITFNMYNLSVSVENYTDVFVFKPFGLIENPTYDDLENFVADRCMPKTRVNAKEILYKLGIPEYDEFAIINATHGGTCFDQCWIKFGDEDTTTYDDVRKLFGN